MNRTTVWVLGIISGILLFFGVTLVGAHGYGVTSGCASYGANPLPCSPALRQITIASPLQLGEGLVAGLPILLLAILIGLPAWIASPILAARRGTSARTAILIVSVIASALVIVSAAIPFLASPALATPQTCLTAGDGSQMCYYGSQAALVALVGIGLPSLVGSLLLGMPAWVMALTETARRKRWGWFVAVLCCSPFAAMLYGFFGSERHAPAPPQAAPARPAVAP